ncbi:MFS transporter [Nocardia fluminea]|uniref:MFS transporter n=1 Tax=Nocardia fluminea TaxID=134984 RepID=UPI0034463F24
MSTKSHNRTAAESPGAVITSDAETGRLDGASRARIFSVLAVIVLFTEVAPMQYTIVAAALQKIAPTFPGVGANINWAIIIFGLIGAAASPLLGKMSDVWGKKRMFLVCGVLFTIGCVLSAVTDSWTVFLIGRALQATAIATAVIAYGLIRDLLPRAYVPLGLGITATGLGFSAITGPLLGGYLVDNYSWRAIFWVLAGFTVLMMPLVWLVVPESRLRVQERIDVLGAVLLSAGAGLTLVYLDKGQDWGWREPTTLAWLIGGIALLAVFVVVELKISRPIMDMQLLFHPRVALVLGGALFASFLIGVQSYALGYMTQSPDSATVTAGIEQATLGRIQQTTGQPMPTDAVQVTLDPGYSYGNSFTLLDFALRVALPQGVLAMICGVLAGLIARRIGARIPLVVALLVFVAAGVAYAVLPHTPTVFVWVSAVFGIGFGFYYASMPILMVEAVPQEQQGISLGMLGIMQSMGVAVGLAIVTACLTASPITAHISVAGQPMPDTVVPQLFADRGYELGFWFASGAALIALIIAVIMRHGRTPATGGTAH